MHIAYIVQYLYYYLTRLRTLVLNIYINIGGHLKSKEKPPGVIPGILSLSPSAGLKFVDW